MLKPHQALYYLKEVMAKRPMRVVGIAGPGDPFANAEETMQTMRIVRAKYPDMILCVASNGLELADYASELAELNVSHVTVTLNAVDASIGEKIYSWVRFNKRVYRGREGAEMLLLQQLKAIKALKHQIEGLTAKVESLRKRGVPLTEADVMTACKAQHLS